MRGDVYEYKTLINRVIDGDTVEAQIDLGFNLRMNLPIRLLGLNAPEHNTPEGVAAKIYVIAWVEKNGPNFILTTVKDKKEKYGRYLGTIATLDGATLNASLLTSEHAKPWDGKGERP